jgi:Glycosyl transferase family 2
VTFAVERNGGGLEVRFPVHAYPAERVEEAVRRLPPGGPIEFAGDGDRATLRAQGAGVEGAVSRFFAALNGYPVHGDGLLGGFENSAEPLVSCIVLLPFNDLFARTVILPGIIENSAGVPIEIVIVDAGFGTNLEPFDHLRIVHSELTSIARGFNNGVRAARGEFVALFHDDCFVDDPDWIQKSLEGLAGEVVAVTPEFDSWYGVPVGKAVPLVMRREKFLELGGYDEFYYVGVEDMDLSCTVLAHGLRQERVDIRYRHLRGMGTSLTVHEDPLQLRRLFGLQVLPAEVVRRVHADSMSRLLSHDFVRLLEGRYHMHFIDKFHDLLRGRFRLDAERLRDFYATLLLRHLSFVDIPVLDDRDRLLAAYLRMMNIDGLRAAA